MASLEELTQGFLMDLEMQLPGIVEELSRALGTDLEVDPQDTSERDVRDSIGEFEYPLALIRFVGRGRKSGDHLLCVQLKLAQAIHKLKSEDTLDESDVEAQLNSLQDVARQVLNVIPGAMQDEGDSDGESLQVVRLESAGEADKFISAEQGVTTDFAINLGTDRFNLRHFVLPVVTEDFSENGNEQNGNFREGGRIDAHPVDFGQFPTGNGEGNNSQNLEILMDVELDVVVELGIKSMLIKDILKLGKGSIVELNKAAGEPLEVFVNGKCFAEGEVVVVDDQFGIRITQLLDTKARILSLK